MEMTKSHMCFSNLFALKIDLTKPKEKIFLKQDGITIKIHGFSEGTRS